MAWEETGEGNGPELMTDEQIDKALGIAEPQKPVHISSFCSEDAARTARAFLPFEFMVIRLLGEELDAFEISQRLGESVARINAAESKIREILKKRVIGITSRNWRRVIQEIGDFGYNTDCTKCKEPVRPDDLHCSECGCKNPHFDPDFYERANGSTLERTKSCECDKGHPEAKAQGHDWFCHICGENLASTATDTSSS
jgi:hypothetical protein